MCRYIYSCSVFLTWCIMCVYGWGCIMQLNRSNLNIDKTLHTYTCWYTYLYKLASMEMSDWTPLTSELVSDGNSRLLRCIYWRCLREWGIKIEGETLSSMWWEWMCTYACMLFPFCGLSLSSGTGEVSWSCRSFWTSLKCPTQDISFKGSIRGGTSSLGGGAVDLMAPSTADGYNVAHCPKQ